MRIRLFIGGDHGQGAFLLGFRVLIDLECGEVLHKTISIATVRCKNDVERANIAAKRGRV